MRVHVLLLEWYQEYLGEQATVVGTAEWGVFPRVGDTVEVGGREYDVREIRWAVSSKPERGRTPAVLRCDPTPTVEVKLMPTVAQMKKDRAEGRSS